MMISRPSMICSTALVASLTGLGATADENIHAEITNCTGIGTVSVTADTPWNVVTDEDTDSVSSLSELPLFLSAEAQYASAAISADMNLDVVPKGANAFNLNIGRDAECGVICGGCSVHGSGEMQLDLELRVDRRSTLRITRYSFWEYDVFPTVTLEAEDGSVRTLYSSANGGTWDEGEVDEFEIEPGTYQLVKHLRFVGCGPYEGDTQFAGGYIALGFVFTPSACSSDINQDGTIDGVDLSHVLGAWGTESNSADINQDGLVDGADLARILGDWGSTCPG